jgi:hypothetical protein
MAMGINPNIYPFGHQWGSQNPWNSEEHSDENMRSNIAKILGYLPLIGTVIGILRFIGLLEREKFSPAAQGDLTTHNYLIGLRALLELFSFGFALLVVDLIFDVVRIS